MPARKLPLSHEGLEPLIFTIRGHRVIFDADLARLYGVTTKVFNQAVKRNPSRFPEDFAFRLTRVEVVSWSQSATLSSQVVDSELNILNLSPICDQFPEAP